MLNRLAPKQVGEPPPTFLVNRDGTIEINWDKYTPYLLERNPNAEASEDFIRDPVGSIAKPVGEFLDENSVNIVAIILGLFVLIVGILLLAK